MILRGGRGIDIHHKISKKNNSHFCLLNCVLRIIENTEETDLLH